MPHPSRWGWRLELRTHGRYPGASCALEETVRALKMTVLWSLVLLLYAAADPFVGTWKLDSSKSKFTMGDPRFIVAIIQIESSGNGLKSTASAADGEGFASDFTFN